MKKLFLPLAIAAITTMASCNQGAKTEGSTGSSDSTEQTAPEGGETPAPSESASTDLPKFSSPEVQKFAEEYSAFVNESIEASKSGDATKVQELAAKAQEWATKTQEATAKMTPEDVKLWSDYYTKLSQQLTNPQ